MTGASAGIGKAFAHALAAEGADVVLLARRADRLASVAHELRRRYDVATEVLVADLSDREGVAEVERRLEDDRAPIDLLVNNAGGSEAGGRGPFLDVDRAVLEGQAMLNGLAVMLLTHAGLTAMKARGSGRVIQVSAGTAFYPIPHGSVYGASKAFVNSFSEAVGFELRGSRVGITVVCPGFTRRDAPARIGFDESNVPSWWWADAEEVVKAALDAAAREKVMCSPTLVNKVNARVGRHLPRLMMRSAARITRKQG